MNRFVVLLVGIAILVVAGAAQAQCCGQPAVAYYAPAPTAVYYAPPTTAYYAPQTVYYAPPTTAYYAPQTVYYAPPVAPIVTTRYRPFLGGTVSRVYYPRPWVAGYWPYY